MTRSALPEPRQADSEARGFLQERLAYLGRVYPSIGITFYLVGNLADASTSGDFSRHLADPDTWVVPLAAVVYLVQWAICRGDALPLFILRFVDATTTILAAAVHSFMVFSTLPGELPGLSYARALLLLTYGLIIRAVVVPSSTRRTLIIGLLATIAPVVTSHVWFTAHTLSTQQAGVHAFWTSLWCLGTDGSSTSSVKWPRRSQKPTESD